VSPAKVKIGRCRGCPDPALCRRLGRHITGRLWEIWTGTAEGLTLDQCGLYRAQWQGLETGPFDRVVLLTLARRPERLRAALAQFTPDRWPFLLPEVFFGVDGSAVPTPPGFSQGAGAWGCLSSHRRIVEQALQDGIEHLLVLEDDIQLRPRFKWHIENFLDLVPKEHDGLMLGGQHQYPYEEVGKGVVRCLNTQRTHAYSGRRKWLEELYRIWHCRDQTVHCDWTMGPAMRRFKIYAPDPFLIGQRRSPSDICGRENPTAFWTPPTGEEPVVLLDVPKKALPSLREQGWHTGFSRDPKSDIDIGLLAVRSGNKQLKAWIEELQWEVVSEEGWILAIWCPGITAAQVQAAWPGPCIEIHAACALAAVQQLKMWRVTHGEGDAQEAPAGPTDSAAG
jgi:hypothetical protein